MCIRDRIMDDYISYDEKHGILVGKESQRKIAKGDFVRGRIIAVSFPRGGAGGKIGITMRQPFLGKIDWIDQDVRRVRGQREEKPA